MSIIKSPESPEVINVIVERLAYTQKKMIEFSYTWTIENFISIPQKLGEPLHSPMFLSTANTSHQWRLILYPKGFNYKNKDYMAIFLWLCEINEPEVRALFEFSVLDSNACKDCVFPSNGIFTFSKRIKQRYHGCYQYILRDNLIKNAANLMPNKNLTIVCNIKMIEDTTNRMTDMFDTKPYKAPDCQINNDIATLFENRKFSDITIVIDDKEIFAHKAILAARSPVFAVMFEIKTENEHRLMVPDTNYEIFIEILRYIYKGEVTNMAILANHLLIAAHKYGLKRLEAQCEITLSKSIVVDNAGPLLVIADFCKANYLKQRIIDFISTHTLELKNNEKFNDIIKGQPRLLIDAIDILAKRVMGLPTDTSSS